MDVQELAEALNRAGVDSSRYVLVPLLAGPWAWQLRPEGSVWLTSGVDHWSVMGGGIAPHYDATGDLCVFNTEERACEVFLRELTGRAEPFAAEKTRFGVECARLWWEDEVRIALEEPDVGRQRARWRETWRERELLGRELMTVGELEEALVAAGVNREALQLEGLDETNAPRAGAGVVLSHDDQGRWYWGTWDSARPGLLWLQYRFETEGEACQSLYHARTGPLTMTAPLSHAQWRLQRSVALDNETAIKNYDEQQRWRREHELPRTADELPGWLYRHGVAPERYWITGMTHREALPDAVCLILDEATAQWRAEGELRGGSRAVLRRFASQAEAFEVFERELTRTDGTPFAPEQTAASSEGGL